MCAFFIIIKIRENGHLMKRSAKICTGFEAQISLKHIKWEFQCVLSSLRQLQDGKRVI